MLHQEKNTFGVISVDDAFLEQMIKDGFKPFKEKAWLVNYKNSQQDFLIRMGNYDLYKQYDVKETEKGIYLKLYLLVQFGQSISKISNGIIDYIADIIKNSLELDIDDIIVEVTGVYTTKKIKKTEIIFSYNEKH